jgi:hypothetical protein
LSVLDVAEEDGELGEGLWYVSFELDGGLFLDRFAGCLFQLDVAWVGQAQLCVGDKRRLEVGNRMDKNSALGMSVQYTQAGNQT